MPKIPKIKAPLLDGEFHSYIHDESELETNNFMWHDHMQFDGFHRGKSAARFRVRSLITDKVYEIFLIEMQTILENANIQDGKFQGMFCFCKRGRQYSLRYLTNEDRQEHFK